MLEESDFPQNPLLPSLRYAASQQIPITIPWAGPVVALGTGFDTANAGTEKPILKELSAFTSNVGDEPCAIYQEVRGGSYIEASTTSNGQSYDHMSLSVAAEVGGSFLGASGQGSYETKAMACRDAAKASIRSTISIGSATYAQRRHISGQAKNILRGTDSENQDPTDHFRKVFGDYYVTAVNIGASAATMVSASAAGSSSSKDFSARITAKFLGMEKSKDLEDHEAEQAFAGYIFLNGYDSLKNASIADSGDNAAASYASLRSKADANLELSRRVGGRIEQAVVRLGCFDGARLSQKTYEALFEQHLVASLTLTPFAHHRDYVEACVARG